MGLEAGVLKLFVDKGYKNMAMFAFSCNYSPGSTNDKPFTDMLQSTRGREPNAAELSILRRFFNESYANVAADIEAQVKQTAATVSRTLAPAERAERLKLQQAKLKGQVYPLVDSMNLPMPLIDAVQLTRVTALST